MAAGLGFKTFQTGEVLTAADTNGYLMQGILVFASAAARTSAVTSPQEGQYSYLKDTNALEYYDGAAWVGAPVGDITAVTAGTGISGGGSSGAVTITNDMATTITASGDIVVGTGSGTYDNLPIGSTGQVLTADTTVSPYKVKWAAPSSGAMTFINRTTFSAQSSVIIDSIFTSTYESYLIVIERIQGTTGSDDLQMQLRVGASTTATNYFGTTVRNTSSGVFTNYANVAQFTLADNIGKANQPDQLNFIITNVGNTSEIPTFSGTGVEGETPGGVILLGGTNMTAATYTGILLKPSAGTMTGEVTIYGLAKA